MGVRPLVTPGNIHYLYVMQRLTTLLLLASVTFTAKAQTNCGLLHDSNANGFVDIEDFLSILGLFGDQDSDGDGLYDSLDNCIDLAACNFMEVDSEFCTYPDAIGDCNGNCQLDEDGDGVCDFNCGTPFNYQGYDYATVLIGEQCWFAENLRSENYANGDAIPSNLSSTQWGTTTSGAVAVLYEDPTMLETYGRLYNWYAVGDARGLCPSGWLVPSDEEWMTLEVALGMNELEADYSNWRGTDQGVQMKTTSGWILGGNGSNSSGFSGLPGGTRNYNGYPSSDQQNGNWWSSSPSSNEQAWQRRLHFDNESVYRGNHWKRNGYSVRCLKD